MAIEPTAVVRVKTVTDRSSLRRAEKDITRALARVEKLSRGGGLLSKAYTQPLGKITGAVGEFEKSLDASNARVVAFGASAGVIYGVTRAFESMVRSAISLEHKLAEVNVILNASTANLQKFGDSLFEVAKNTGQTFDVVADAALEFARQGLAVEETLKRTRDAMILTRLSGLDYKSSVESITATINSFNRTIITSTELVNKLANVDAAFAVSSADLAKAVSRVGSSAQDANVSLDQLIAMVTTAQQVTARGGAVIGNSLKTIFTRIQRPAVIANLEAFGVAVTDAQGATLPAIQVLQNFADSYERLSPKQRAITAEMVGGVFQVNILKAALGDLGKEFSIYERALGTSINTTDEAIQRNELLNKTLQTLLNETMVNVMKVGAKIGDITLSPAIRNVLEGINKALDQFQDNASGDKIGVKMGKGMLEGIGQIIKGPGMIILGALLGKLLYSFMKFSTDAVKTFAGMNEGARKQAEIQQLVQNILLKNPDLIGAATSSEENLRRVSEKVLEVIRNRNFALAQSAELSAQIATNLSRADLAALNVSMTGGGGATAGAWRPVSSARGFIPNFNRKRDEEAEIAGAVSGGYKPGRIKRKNIKGTGTVTYNDAEKVKKFPGMQQEAIMPPKRSGAGKTYEKKFKDRHGFDPYAYGGFIPNLASFGANSKKHGGADKYVTHLAGLLNDPGASIQGVAKNEGFVGNQTIINWVTKYRKDKGGVLAQAGTGVRNKFLSAYDKVAVGQREERKNIKRGNDFEDELTKRFKMKGKQGANIPFDFVGDFGFSKHKNAMYKGKNFAESIGMSKQTLKATDVADAHGSAGHKEFEFIAKFLRHSAKGKEARVAMKIADKLYPPVGGKGKKGDAYSSKATGLDVAKELGTRNTFTDVVGRGLDHPVSGGASASQVSTNWSYLREALLSKKRGLDTTGAKKAGKGKEGDQKRYDLRAAHKAKKKFLRFSYNVDDVNVPGFAGGHVPNFATKILDKDQLAQHMGMGMASKEVKMVWDAIVNQAVQRGQIAETIIGTAGIGKTTEAIKRAGGKNFVTDAAQLSPSDQLIIVRAAQSVVNTPDISRAKKITYLKGSREVVKGMRKKRGDEIRAGIDETGFGRDPGAHFGSTSGVLTEALLAEKYAGKLSVFERQADMSLKEAEEFQTINELKGKSATIGAFSPWTVGHQDMARTGGANVAFVSKGAKRGFDVGLSTSEKARLIELADPNIMAVPGTAGIQEQFEHGGKAYRMKRKDTKVVLGADRVSGGEEDISSSFKDYKGVTPVPGRLGGVSGTKIRQAIVQGNVSVLKANLPPEVFRVIKKNIPVLQKRAAYIQQRKDNATKALEALEADKASFHVRHGARKKKGELSEITSARQMFTEKNKRYQKRLSGYGGKAWGRLGLNMNFASQGFIPNFAKYQVGQRLPRGRGEGGRHLAVRDKKNDIYYEPNAGMHARVVQLNNLRGKTKDGGWLFPDGRYEQIQGHDGSGLQAGGLIPNFAYGGLHEKDYGTTMVGRKGAMGKDMTEKQVKKMTAGMRMIRGPEGETLIVGSDMTGRSGRMIASGLSARKIKKSGPVWRTMLSQVPHLFDGLAYDLVGGVAGAKFDPEGTTGAMAGVKFENEMAESLGQAKPGAKKGSDFQVAETIAKKLKTQKNLQLKLALHERSKRDPSKIVDIASSFSKYLVDILTHNIKTNGLSTVTTPDRFKQAMGVLEANPAVKDDWLKYFGPMGTKAMGHVPNLAGVYDWDDTIVNYPRDDKWGMPPIETGVLSGVGKGLQASGEQFDVLTARNPEAIPAIQKYAKMHGLKIGNLRAVGDRKKSSAKSKGKVLEKYPKGTKFFDDDPRNIKAGHLAGANVQQVGDPHGPSWVKEKRWKEEARGYANASGFIPNFAPPVSPAMMKSLRGLKTAKKKPGDQKKERQEQKLKGRTTIAKLKDSKDPKDQAIAAEMINSQQGVGGYDYDVRQGTRESMLEAVYAARIKTVNTARDKRKKAKAEDKREMIFSGGGGGSGKSFTLEAMGLVKQDKERIMIERKGAILKYINKNQAVDIDRILGKEHTYISADDIKVMMPQYHDLLAFNYADASGVVHKESSRLAKKMAALSTAHGADTIFDTVLKGDKKAQINAPEEGGLAFDHGLSKEDKARYAEIRGRVAKSLRYKAKIIAVLTPVENALNQATDRAEKTGRTFPPELILKGHKGFLQNILSNMAASDAEDFGPDGDLMYLNFGYHGEDPNHPAFGLQKREIAMEEQLLGRPLTKEERASVIPLKKVRNREEAQILIQARIRDIEMAEEGLRQLNEEALRQGGKGKRATQNQKHTKHSAHEGLVPNFSRDALQSAVEREKAAGYGSGQVRVGYDSRLRESGGVGVYNTTEGSLSSAINLHLRSGKNIGQLQDQGASQGQVPNFQGGAMDMGMAMMSMSMMAFTLKDLGKSFKELGDNSLDPFKKAVEEAEEAVKTLAATEGEAVKALEAGESAEAAIQKDIDAGETKAREARDVPAAEIAAQADAATGVTEAGKDLRELEKQERNLPTGSDTGSRGSEKKEEWNRLKDEAKTQIRAEGGKTKGSTAKAAIAERARVLAEAQAKLIEDEIKVAKQSLTDAKKKAVALDKEADAHEEQAGLAEEQVRKARENLEAQKDKNVALRDTADASSMEATLGDEKLSGSKEALAKEKKRPGRKKKSIKARIGGFMDKGGATSVMAGAPMMAGMAAGFMKEDDQVGKAVVQGAGNVAGMAATGAQMGMILGPWGAAAGAVIGGIVGMIGAANELKRARLREKMKEFKDQAEALGEKLNGVTSGGQAYMTSLDQLNGLMKDTSKPMDPAVLAKMRSKMVQAIGSIPAEFQDKFKAAAGDAGKIKEIFAEITADLSKSKADLEAAATGYELREKFAAGTTGIGGNDTTLFEKDKMGDLTTEGKRVQAQFKNMMAKGMDKKALEKAVQEGTDIDFAKLIGKGGDMGKAQEFMGEGFGTFMEDLQKAKGSGKDMEHIGKLLNEVFVAMKDGKVIADEAIATSIKKNYLDKLQNKTLKDLAIATTNYNTILGKVVSGMQSRFKAMEKLSDNLKKFTLDLAAGDVKGARKLADPFLTKRHQINLDTQSKIVAIDMKSIQDFRKAVTSGTEKQFGVILNRFTKVNSKVAEQQAGLTTKSSKEQEGHLARSRKAQEAMLPVMNQALEIWSSNPKNLEALKVVTDEMATILEKGGMKEETAASAAALTMEEIKQHGKRTQEALAASIQQRNHQIKLAEQQNYWSQKSAELNARIASFGGAGQAFQEGGKGGLSKGFDSFAGVLGAQIKGAVSNSIVDIGRANARLLDSLMNKMNFDSLRDNIAALGPLLSTAIAGRARDIQRQVGYAQRVTQIAQPGITMPGVDAEKIATEQIAQQLKLNQLPDDVQKLRENSEILNHLIMMQTDQIIDGNKGAFGDALRLNGIPQNMHALALGVQDQTSATDRVGSDILSSGFKTRNSNRDGFNANMQQNGLGFANMISASREVQKIASNLPTDFDKKSGATLASVMGNVQKGLTDALGNIAPNIAREMAEYKSPATKLKQMGDITDQLVLGRGKISDLETKRAAFQNAGGTDRMAELRHSIRQSGKTGASINMGYIIGGKKGEGEARNQEVNDFGQDITEFGQGTKNFRNAAQMIESAAQAMHNFAEYEMEQTVSYGGQGGSAGKNIKVFMRNSNTEMIKRLKVALGKGDKKTGKGFGYDDEAINSIIELLKKAGGENSMWSTGPANYNVQQGNRQDVNFVGFEQKLLREALTGDKEFGRKGGAAKFSDASVLGAAELRQGGDAATALADMKAQHDAWKTAEKALKDFADQASISFSFVKEFVNEKGEKLSETDILGLINKYKLTTDDKGTAREKLGRMATMGKVQGVGYAERFEWIKEEDQLRKKFQEAEKRALIEKTRSLATSAPKFREYLITNLKRDANRMMPRSGKDLTPTAQQLGDAGVRQKAQYEGTLSAVANRPGGSELTLGKHIAGVRARAEKDLADIEYDIEAIDRDASDAFQMLTGLSFADIGGLGSAGFLEEMSAMRDQLGGMGDDAAELFGDLENMLALSFAKMDEAADIEQRRDDAISKWKKMVASNTGQHAIKALESWAEQTGRVIDTSRGKFEIVTQAEKDSRNALKADAGPQAAKDYENKINQDLKAMRVATSPLTAPNAASRAEQAYEKDNLFGETGALPEKIRELANTHGVAIHKKTGETFEEWRDQIINAINDAIKKKIAAPKGKDGAGAVDPGRSRRETSQRSKVTDPATLAEASNAIIGNQALFYTAINELRGQSLATLNQTGAKLEEELETIAEKLKTLKVGETFEEWMKRENPGRAGAGYFGDSDLQEYEDSQAAIKDARKKLKNDASLKKSTLDATKLLGKQALIENKRKELLERLQLKNQDINQILSDNVGNSEKIRKLIQAFGDLQQDIAQDQLITALADARKMRVKGGRSTAAVGADGFKKALMQLVGQTDLKAETSNRRAKALDEISKRRSKAIGEPEAQAPIKALSEGLTDFLYEASQTGDKDVKSQGEMLGKMGLRENMSDAKLTEWMQKNPNQVMNLLENEDLKVPEKMREAMRKLLNVMSEGEALAMGLAETYKTSNAAYEDNLKKHKKGTVIYSELKTSFDKMKQDAKNVGGFLSLDKIKEFNKKTRDDARYTFMSISQEAGAMMGGVDQILSEIGKSTKRLVEEGHNMDWAEKETEKMILSMALGDAQAYANQELENAIELSDTMLTVWDKEGNSREVSAISTEALAAAYDKAAKRGKRMGKVLDGALRVPLLARESKDIIHDLNQQLKFLADGAARTGEAVSAADAAFNDFVTNQGSTILVEQLKDAALAKQKAMNHEMGRTLEAYNANRIGSDKMREAIERASAAAIDAGDFGIDQFTNNLLGGFLYNANDFQKDLAGMATQFGQDFRTGTASAFSEAIKGTKTLKQAFSDMFADMADSMLDKALQMGVNAMFDAILPGPKAYATGGIVSGGSGTKDDVPAYLTKGEYVIKKSAVNSMGKEFFDALNQGTVTKAAKGGAIAVKQALSAKQAAELKKNTAMRRAGIESFSYREADPDKTKKDWLGRDTGQAIINTKTDYKVNLNRPLTSERIEAIRKLANQYPEIGRNLDRELFDNSIMQIGDGKYKVHLRNKFIYDNMKRPEFSKMLADSRLSAHALTDENNPQNRYKFEKRDAFFNYQHERMEFLKDQDEQLEAFHEQKKNRRRGFLFGAASMLISAGLTGGKSTNDMSAAVGRAMGGLNADDVPALLTGGEYVVSKKVVDSYGSSFFDELNSGKISKYATGGLVSKPQGSGGTSTSRMGANSASGTGATTNNISISVSVDSSGKVTADSEKSGSATDLTQEESKELASKIKTSVLDVIVQQKRPGGMLYERR